MVGELMYPTLRKWTGGASLPLPLFLSTPFLSTSSTQTIEAPRTASSSYTQTNIYSYGKANMVQTKDGATENPWITYMRTCAANYRAGLVSWEGEAYPREKSQSGRERPCTCKSSQMVSPPSHAKRKRGTEASASEPSKKSKNMK